MRIWSRRLITGLLIAGVVASSALGETRRLLILHTNDIHDHVRPGEYGLGGLPYVAGYIEQVRAERGDVLLVDAGDVTEKGDIVATRTGGVMTYEMLARIGYDAVAVGNHDFDDIPLARIREFERALGERLLCLNINGPDGAPLFAGSRMVERGGLRVGLIGLIVPRKPEQGGLDFEASGHVLAREAGRLRADGAQIIVAVCHEQVSRCAEWSRIASGVNVFVSGHSHEAVEPPRVVPETGAIIVQAGSYARWVGRLEIEFDPEKGQIVAHDGRLVPMTHTKITPDAAMLAWVMEKETEIAPEASEFVFHNPSMLDPLSLARLAADGLRIDSGADIGFCHAYQVIREALPVGPIDLNALFLTGGHRGQETVILNLSGAEVAAYANALYQIQNEPPEWTGFRVAACPSPNGTRRTDLDPARTYRVVMPRIEYETRLLRLAAKLKKNDPANPLAGRKFTARPTRVNYTDSLRGAIERLLEEGDSPHHRAEQIVADRELEK